MEGKAEGKAEGKSESQKKTIHNLLNLSKGMSLEQIAKVVDVPLKLVEQISHEKALA